MTQNPRRNYWPYDEVTASRDSSDAARFVVSAPWLTFQFRVDPADIKKADQIASKITQGQLTPDDLSGLNWFFSSLSGYPFAYILPRPSPFGSDQHIIKDHPLNLQNPTKALFTLAKNSAELETITKTATTLAADWTWDVAATLNFSQTEKGFDPESIFSVCRRFHLLNDLESNKTADLFKFMSDLKSNKEEFRKISALVMRQNHYITQKCEPTLSAALPLAQGAFDEISEFIKAESGHDNILAKAMSALGARAEDVPVIDCTVTLMELFKLIAQKNILAFSMVVDIFERSTYRGEDPLANVLQDGGETKAADQIEVHREINDSGGHENVALEFLADMGPVSKDYAIEAMRLSELLTLVIHQMSKQTLEFYQQTQK